MICKICEQYISEWNRVEGIFCPIHSICFMIKAKQYEEIYQQNERKKAKKLKLSTVKRLTT